MNNKKSILFKNRFGSLTEKPLRWWDFLILFGIMAFCFFAYEMRDLYHTAGCSFGFLDGHFADFYDYLSKSGIAEDGTIGLHASYMPTVYLIFAIWNLPLKLFGIVPSATACLGFGAIMWAKVLPCLVFLGSGYVVLLICKELGMENRKAKICMYAYISMPVALFSQFVLGQYESFILLFILLGVLSWLRGKNISFVVYFGIAVTFKITAVLFFIPLLVLREKNVWKILLSCIGICVLFGIEFLLFSHSEAFMSYTFGIGSSGDNPTGYINNAMYFTGYELGGGIQYVVYLCVLAFAGVVAYAYFKKTENKQEESRYALFVLCLTGAALFGFSKWHPHWLMLLVPFYTITAFMHKNTKIWMVIDLIFMGLFVMFSVCMFQGVCDEIMINKGFFKFLLPGGQVTSETQMSEYLGKIDLSMQLSLLTALIFIGAIFKHPKFMAEDVNLTVDKSMGWIRARYIVGILIFIIPSLFVVKDNLNPAKTAYLEERRGIFVTFDEVKKVSQNFTSEGESIKKLKFPVSRGENEQGNEILFSIEDESGKALYEKTLSTKNYGEGELITINPSVDLKEGATYRVIFEMTDGDEDTTFSLLAFNDNSYENAVVDGKTANYHLDMNIYQ